METLAYLHLELSYEAPTDTIDEFTLESIQLFEWLKRQKLATHARIYLLSLIAILSILGMAGEALAQRVLRLGDRGPDVTEVQRRLRELGYFYQQPTGYFGSATRDAVSQFQQERRLAVDGIVGSRTEAALFGSGRPGRLQVLNTLPPPPGSGLPPLATNTDENTDEEPIGFGTPIRTGVYVLQRGDRNPEVTRLQRELRRRGFNPGSIDGIYGERTEEAVRQFQREYDLDDDGIAGRETLTALGLVRGRDLDPNRYVVVVPGDNNTLYQVRQENDLSRATLRELGRGTYVDAGAFADRDSAESLSYRLRARGFDARVVYFR